MNNASENGTVSPAAPMADAAASASSAVLIYTTFPSESEAKKAARALVEAGLAACANIFPHMTAIYAWEGKVEEGAEAAMILKTVQGRLDEALAALKELHPYSTPARLALPVAGGGEDFLSWIAAQCRMPQRPV